MKVQVIGRVAKNLFGQAASAQVAGSSRHGVYLLLDRGWVVFLSGEAHPGPLTLNLDEVTHLSTTLSSGMFARGTPSSISFPQAGLDLLLDNARVWSAPPAPHQVQPVERRKEISAQVIWLAQEARPTPGLAALSVVLGSSKQELEGEARLFYPYLGKAAALAAGRVESRSLEPLLGMGGGLTPSGDDILLGLLLALNRWGEVLAPRLDRPALNRELLSLAYARTTTLSANLLECASQGQADERLVIALDGLMTGAPGADQVVNLLASWGNSSGLDALCGMACVLFN